MKWVSEVLEWGAPVPKVSEKIGFKPACMAQDIYAMAENILKKPLSGSLKYNAR